MFHKPEQVVTSTCNKQTEGRMSKILYEASPDCEIVTIRDFQANREMVYEAWTNPIHLANWWGPRGFTNTFSEFDFRVGGRWKFVMHGPEKGNYPNEVEFTEIIPLELIAWNRITQPWFQVVTTFVEVSKNLTKLSFRMVFKTAEECNKLKRFVVEKNEENMDKLEEELRKMNSGT